MRRFAFILPLVALAAPLSAEPGLPDPASVASALQDHPSVAAARERTAAAKASAEARRVGPHEVTASGSYSRRTIDREGEFDEFDAQLTRAFRLPGKARLDREIGVYQVDAAENMAEDVRHRTALRLAEYWWDWMGAAAEARVNQRALANYETALSAVNRRVELGDAAQLEADQAQAALESARIMVEEATGRTRLARARLEAQFPTLALPAEAPEVPPPSIAEGALLDLREEVIRNSHEVAAAEAEARRAAAYSQRVEADRIADPSFGIRMFSERGGAERGAGVVFSMPLGGRHRAALAGEAGSQAAAALADERLARFEVAETADADIAEARFRLSAWQSARASLEAQMAMLTKLRRGQQLGEIDLADMLLGERMVHDAFRTEAELRTAAQRAITRLRIDAHELWLTE
ncbi:outer membrane protein TolC [Altererythrobacter atlanticus]|uniref:Outer membrane efflux protein n=1 Tax=Croceibacterium atlanticum TaxID=1267766 RepID=A0A0F7KTI1_9SPHN|nr:TolC family protein [Croceibacterium atlanticum]AKH42874.1 Outer membrane efflux protein [Croceibacterium atlanticum]MBB5731654.1 outer membrane protein TolC [Croceibacterium atlanticum]